MLVVLCIVGLPACAEESRTTEHWWVVRLDGAPVGYETLTISQIGHPSAGSFEVSCVRRTRIQLRRLSREVRLETTLSTRQTTDGRLLEFSLQRTDADGSQMTRRGTYDAHHSCFHVDERVHAARRRYDIRVAEDVVYSPVFESWAATAVGDDRRRVSVSVFYPEAAKIFEVSVEQRLPRTIRLFDRRQVVSNTIRIAPLLEPTRATTMYTAPEDSRVLLAERRFLGRAMQQVNAPADVALATVSNRTLDLDVAGLVPLDRLLKAAHTRRTLVLDLSVADGILRDVPETPFQQPQRLSESTVRIVLTRPEVPKSEIRAIAERQQKPLKSTRWLPAEDPEVRRLAVLATGVRKTPMEACRQMTQFLHAKMRTSAFSTEIIPADRVAHSLRGDCTEHAVLLAAMMRSHGIPSRVVTGLVHTGSQYGFTGHMWVEAQINDRWFPFDSTVGVDGVGTTHIKLADSDLPDSLNSPVTLFLPVLEIAGRASIRVVAEE